jgi:hypothetical protein
VFKTLGVILSLVICLLPNPASAEDFIGWSHSAPIEVVGNGKYKMVFLTPEIYQQAAANLADLRLVDSNGETVPYYIQKGELVRQQSETVIAARLTESFEAGDDSYFEYRLNVEDNIDPLGNRLVFTLPDGVFAKHIEAYGSHDGVKWQYLVKDYIYRVEGREKREVPLGEDRKFRYYRIRMLDNTERVTLKGMALVSRKDITSWNRYEQETQLDYDITSQNRQTVITIKNPYKLHLKSLVLDIDDNFQRTYGVYGDAKAAYPLQTGDIYNLRFAGVDITNKAVRFKPALANDTIVIKIDDRDDRPLNIKGIKAEYYLDKLVFPNFGNTPYRLYFGNEKAVAPRYELGMQRSFIEKENQDECRLLAVENNQTVQQVWSKLRSDYLFDGAIVAVSLLLIFVLIPKLKSTR